MNETVVHCHFYFLNKVPQLSDCVIKIIHAKLKSRNIEFFDTILAYRVQFCNSNC